MHDDPYELRGLTRRQALGRASAATALLTLPGLLAACGSDDGDAGGGGGDIARLTWALSAGIRSLDLASSFDVATLTVLSTMHDRLVTYDSDLRLAPQLAESWEGSGTRYVYRLRSDASFWDGSPVTADDVVASFQRHVDPRAGSQLNPYFLNVANIEASGAHEVTVTLRAADVFWQYTPVLVSILPKAFIDANGRRIGTPAVKTMGSGPYEVVTFSPDKGVTLRRNESYWGPKPAVRTIDLRFLTDVDSRLLAVRSREIQGSFDVPLDQARQWDSVSGARTVYAPGLSVQFLSFDMDAEPWSDVHVRRAFAHAIDREGLVNAALAGHGQPAQTIVPPQQWAGLASEDEVDELYASLPSYDYDLEMARAELAQSSVPDGFKATLPVPSSNQVIVKIALSIKESVSQIGIDLDVREVPFEQWIATLFGHRDLGLQISGYSPDYPDPGNYPSVILNSVNAAPNAFNTANFRDAEVDRLLGVQAQSSDAQERIDALGQVLRVAGEQLPYAPIAFLDTGLIVSDRFEYEGFNGLYYFQDMAGRLSNA